MTKFSALSNPAQLVIICFGLAGLFSAGWAVFASETPQYERLALLVLLGAVTARAKVKLSNTSTLSLLTSVVMLSLMLNGVIAAVAVGITGVTIQALLPSRKFVPHRFAFNAAMVVLAIHAASISIIGSLPECRVSCSESLPHPWSITSETRFQFL